jgi:UDP-N-acetyl-D-mannosaminuronate dehydrogenase
VIPGLLAAGAQVEYHDPHVPQLRLPDGSVLEHTADAVEREYDLVVVHTAHASTPLDWVLRHPLVLDTTYRLPRSPSRAVL